LTRKYGGDAVVTELTTHTYFIGQSDWPDDAGGVVRSLFRGDGDGAPEEILQGVEDMQIAYGIDANEDGQADTFQDASTVADWSQVVSTRFSLLMNSIDPASDTEAAYLYVGGSVSIDPASASPITPTDRLLRQEFMASMVMRNNIL
jgi:type IV pilus assembly protein PilW